MKNIIHKLGSFPYYVFGIILFFLTHGYSENAGLIPFSGMLVFFLIATAIAFLLLLFFRKKMGSFIKAGIIAGLIIFSYLFYGALQDGLKAAVFLYQLSKYRVFLPGIIIVIIFLYFFIKKSAQGFKTLTLYINMLLLVLIIVDLTSISGYFFKEKDSDEVKKSIVAASLLPCDSCTKPDIYLIVLDEYWGNNSLKNYFNYDNSSFTAFLKNEGFFVASVPSSNYACTPVSMAATLDMKYLQWLKGHKQADAVDYAIGAKLIRTNLVVSYLKSLGYEIKNQSIFDMDGKDAVFNVSDLPVKLKLITAKTLWERINTDLSWNIRVKFAAKHKWAARILQSKYIDGNNRVLHLINQEIFEKKINRPRFIYAHLFMPHYPYIYDSSGNEQYNHSYFNSNLAKSKNDSAYLQYLIYTNKVISNVVQSIIEHDKENSVIVLMSDHGNRSFTSSNSNKLVSANNNFNAILLPKRNYSFFYDSISNVNQFRALFNTLFNQQLPILKDSVVF